MWSRGKPWGFLAFTPAHAVVTVFQCLLLQLGGDEQSLSLCTDSPARRQHCPQSGLCGTPRAGWVHTSLSSLLLHVGLSGGEQTLKYDKWLQLVPYVIPLGHHGGIAAQRCALLGAKGQADRCLQQANSWGRFHAASGVSYTSICIFFVSGVRRHWMLSHKQLRLRLDCSSNREVTSGMDRG